MRKTKQEAREEKINRQIRNVSRVLEQEPTLKSLRECRAELEMQLNKMPLEERRALVPWEETERERKECIATLTDLIADYKMELETKRKEIRGKIAELRQCRAKFVRQARHS